MEFNLYDVFFNFQLVLKALLHSKLHPQVFLFYHSCTPTKRIFSIFPKHNIQMQKLETELPTGTGIRKQARSVMGVTTETNGITCPTTLQTVEDCE